MRFSTLCGAALLTALGVSLPVGLGTAFADGVTTRPDILPVSAIRPGMKGYGLTVFQGVTPERFEVEVIDVLRNFRPRQELILIKTKHPRLDVAKVVSGMSGSPIYIDGKMIGAYAYGWTFGVEPVAGVTPIRSMLDDLVRPLPDSIYGFPLKVVPSRRSEAGAPRAALKQDSGGRFASLSAGHYDLGRHAEVLHEKRNGWAGPSSVLKPVTTPLLMGGLSGASVALAREYLSPLGLEPLEAGGGGDQVEPDAPKRFVDGGAIGVQLVRGDMSAMGLGTVTRVEGDRLVAFGHPMMQSGVTALPTAIGRVLWFLASDMRSFKIGMPVRPVGTLVNDRSASIVVSHSVKAPTIPVSLHVRGLPGAPYTTWNFEVAHEKFMTPMFVALALGTAIETLASERRDVTWNAVTTLKVEGHKPVKLKDFGVAIGGTPDAQELSRSNLVGAVGALLNNPWKPVLVEGASTEVEVRFAREILALRGVEVLEPEIDAGQPARIRLTLEPYAGPRQTRVVKVPIPSHLAGDEVKIDIAPGYLVERDQPDPENVPELIRFVEDPVYPPKSVVFSFSTGQGGVTFRGRVAKNLPPGAMDSIDTTSSSLNLDTFRSEDRHVVMLPEFMTGRESVSVTVRPVLR